MSVKKTDLHLPDIIDRLLRIEEYEAIAMIRSLSHDLAEAKDKIKSLEARNVRKR